MACRFENTFKALSLACDKNLKRKPIMSTCEDTISDVVELLDPGKRIFVVTGAGISADSGLPTYRGTGGIYEVKETEDNMPIEQALSGSVFRSNPEITWKYLAQIGKSAQGATFNRGHQVIAEMENHFEVFNILTQNVDGFHRDAGSKNLIEIHGNLRYLSCNSCSNRETIGEGQEIPIPPRCELCQNVLRPDVVLFDEMLPEEELQQLSNVWERGFDVVFSVGTTSVFPYIAEPVVWASRNRLPAIEINPDDTNVSRFATHRIRIGAAEALDQIWTLYQKKHQVL